MKKFYYCVRCLDISNEQRSLNLQEVSSLIIARELKCAEFEIENHVCKICRFAIGNEAAEELLKNNKDEKRKLRF